MSSFLGSSAIWEQMEAAGVPGIKGVWNHEGCGSQMFITVAIEQMYQGHAKQAAMAAAGSYAGSYLNKMIVVVDDDIDLTDADAVLWAMCTRVDPDSDLDIVRNCWSSPLDPMAYPEDRRNFNKRMLIDACRPWNRKDTFPKVVEAGAELKERVRKRWPDVCDI
jgi:4-hydroxy-3-polyprenylbenzoate decarboxylase